MRTIKLSSFLLFTLLFCIVNDINSQSKETFKEDWKSIEKVNQAPDWFKDSKFGIYTHWGPVSSAFEGADPDTWYAGWHGMKMYEDGKTIKTKNGKQIGRAHV